jgi:hypothetical protein
MTTGWASYQLDLYTPAGVKADSLEKWSTFTLSRTVNGVGAASFEVAFDPKLWQVLTKDAIFDVWRRDAGGARRRMLDTVWLVIGRGIGLGSDGKWTMTFSCVDALDVLRRWTIPYAAGTPESDKVAMPAESIIKAVVTEQLVTRGGLPLTVENDNGGGTTQTVSLTNQDVLSAVQQTAQTSTQAGDYAAFDLVPSGPTSLVFRYFKGQRGTDRRTGSPVPVTLSTGSGGIGQGSYAEDYSAASSYVRCTGPTTPGSTNAVASFMNGWHNVTPDQTSQTRYSRTASGLVCLGGSVSGTTGGTTAFVLPVGYRPTQDSVFPSTWYNGGTAFTFVIIYADGRVVPHDKNSVDFDGIVFPCLPAYPPVGIAVNETLENIGPFAHTEAFVTQQNTTNPDTLTATANATLRADRPVIGVTNAVIPQTDACRFGRDFDFGDRVMVAFGPVAPFEARIDNLSVTVDGGTGEERFTASLNGEV